MTKVLLPCIVVAASALPLPGGAHSGFDLTAFGRLPVSANGRMESFDSVARTALVKIRGEATTDPTMWLLEVLAKPDTADTRRVFLVKSKELLDKLQLQAASDGTNHYSFKDFGSKASAINDQAKQLASVKASDRAPWQEELIALREKLILYERLKNSLLPNTRLQQDAKGKPITFDFAAELARYRTDLDEALRVDAGRRRGSPERLAVPVEMRIRTFARLFQVVSSTGMLAVVPPPRPTRSGTDWKNLGTIIVNSARGQKVPAPVTFYAGMASAFAQDKPEAFNAQVAQYREWLAANDVEVRKARLK